jgi:hypothetical protein
MADMSADLFVQILARLDRLTQDMTTVVESQRAMEGLLEVFSRRWEHELGELRRDVNVLSWRVVNLERNHG